MSINVYQTNDRLTECASMPRGVMFVSSSGISALPSSGWLNWVYVTAEAIRRRKYIDYIGRSGPGSVVGIATADGLDDPGIESRCRRDFPHLSRSALRSTHPPVQ
jgi:hypothetical protein